MRLRAIDAPEQSFSARAKPFTSERAYGKIAHVEPTDRDRYGLSFAKTPSGNAGFEFDSAAWLHGEQNGAEAGKDRAMPASLPA
jgi:hypothetical protein